MTVLNDAFEADRQDGHIISCPIASTANIYKGAIVCWNTAGFLVAGANTANLVTAGIAVETSEAVSGESDGARSVRVFRTGAFQIPCSGASQAWVRRQVFIVDDNTVALQTSNKILAGVVVAYVDNTTVKIDICCVTMGAWTEESISSSSSSTSS